MKPPPKELYVIAAPYHPRDHAANGLVGGDCGLPFPSDARRTESCGTAITCGRCRWRSRPPRIRTLTLVRPRITVSFFAATRLSSGRRCATPFHARGESKKAAIPTASSPSHPRPDECRHRHSERISLEIDQWRTA